MRPPMANAIARRLTLELGLLPAEQTFAVCWIALCLLPLGAQGRHEVARAKRVREEFRAIASHPDEMPDNLELTGGTIVLSAEDHAWLVTQVEAIQWKGGNIDAVTAAFAMLDAADAVTASDLKGGA